MNISYDWLRQYIDTNLSPSEIATALTSIGLETGSVEEVESIPGGLRGLVIGEVLTCTPHDNSDHLHVTTVDIGSGEPLQIVCGAPNVAAGHAVVVATVGTTLGVGQGQFTIKKSKIRGVESHGMLCSEVEIGLGEDNSGIILLPLGSVRIGTKAADHFGVSSDYVLEVDITPNRVDATSHYGVARDLAAYLTQHHTPTKVVRPSVPALTAGTCPVEIRTEAPQELVPRFEGVVIRGLRVGESPEWLRRRLESIGQRSINVVVDITNYVLHEIGQPLHAYDLDKVQGGLVVRLATEGSSITTLDGVERTLTGQDLVIADGAGHNLCIAGVMGALESGTTTATTSIVLEAANFHSSSVRRTARRLGLSSDSSFRFERGLSPEATHWALERATQLILELCPGSYVDGAVSDHYSTVASPFEVELSKRQTDRLIGKRLSPEEILRILESLEISVQDERQDGDDTIWRLHVPRYRVDVTRPVDVIEEILRIYGYNSVELSGYIHANLSPQGAADRSYRRRLLLSEQLTGAGFSEILCNSLSSSAYYEGLESYPTSKLVRLANPLSAELDVMRQTLLFGGLASIGRNLRRQQRSFYFYEWGNCYAYTPNDRAMQGYTEGLRLGLWIAGERVSGSWAHADEKTSPFELKAHVEHILRRLGLNAGLMRYSTTRSDLFAGEALEVKAQDGRLVGTLGQVHPALASREDIDLPIYFAELEWDTLQQLAERTKTTIHDLPKYPFVRRDLSLLIDKATTFVEIEAIAYKAEKKLLLRCELFDVYEGKNLPEGKKSYAVSFVLQDPEGTMSDKQIEGIMAKIQRSLESQLSAVVRG